ncbi:MarR family winged helix-turn-helix transcriptional regulator [Pseudonocardia humida]|uniref:Winged helix-turn-helix transcriptional regulator n=1 Tax=Pseudonocardia humida TaxID=2800819 RepID=A0ABT1A3X5_9PSEU|nr:MarR family winged helix-turn-helix transcriptional regulator [Pseudonocardia humida]MCO1657651.1 winged helix-turn-helix transcriptional regulator [Pseudonocardia humida]
MADPDQRLFFLLQRAAHTLRLAADRRCLAAAGITTAQLGALYAVRDQPGTTQRQLARTLGLRESAVTGLVGRLVAADMLTRGAHPDEHRAVVLELSTRGTEALAAVQPEVDRFNAELHDLLGDGFDSTSEAMHRLAHWNPAE